MGAQPPDEAGARQVQAALAACRHGREVVQPAEVDARAASSRKNGAEDAGVHARGGTTQRRAGLEEDGSRDVEPLHIEDGEEEAVRDYHGHGSEREAGPNPRPVERLRLRRSR